MFVKEIETFSQNLSNVRKKNRNIFTKLVEFYPAALSKYNFASETLICTSITMKNFMIDTI